MTSNFRRIAAGILAVVAAFALTAGLLVVIGNQTSGASTRTKPKTHASAVSDARTLTLRDVAKDEAWIRTISVTPAWASTLTASEKATINAALQKDATALQAIASNVASAQKPQARMDYRTVASVYRIEPIVRIQVAVARHAYEIQEAVIPVLQSRLSSLTAKLAKGKTSATNSAVLSNLASETAAINRRLSGLAESAIAYSPAQLAANDLALVKSVRATLDTAVADVAAARKDVAQLERAIRKEPPRLPAPKKP